MDDLRSIIYFGTYVFFVPFFEDSRYFNANLVKHPFSQWHER
jgi:CYTH domain-containing protein